MGFSHTVLLAIIGAPYNNGVLTHGVLNPYTTPFEGQQLNLNTISAFN